MTYSIEFIYEAKLDVKDTYDWYENKVIGLGDRFVSSLNRSVNLIKSNPFQYQTQFGEIRKALLNHFPYQIIYIVESKKIIILGVIHSSRDPIIWENRI